MSYFHSHAYHQTNYFVRRKSGNVKNKEEEDKNIEKKNRKKFF